MIKLGPYFVATGLQSEMTIAITVLDGVTRIHKVEATLTSGVDRSHSWKSLHYVGYAVDFTINNKGIRVLFADDLREVLGPLYDVVLEPSHIHIEYQPKGPINGHWRD